MQQNGLESCSTSANCTESECPWPKLVAHWSHVVPPLRPATQDLGFYWNAAQEWIRQHGAPRVLLLGVTPGLYSLPWPSGTDFLAIDRTQSMIDLSWSGPREAVQCSDWRSMALPDGSRDIVLCDGGLHLLAYPEEQQKLVLLLKNLLSEKGLCLIRLFVPPPHRESPEAVLADLFDGKISNLSILKLRMGMALLNTAAKGVALGEIFQKLEDSVPDFENLAIKIGWPAEHMLAIKGYQGVDFRYHYVTVQEASDMFCVKPGGFIIERLETPTYELGQCCPTIIMKRFSPAQADGTGLYRR
jgi:hypothetical protein